MARVLILDDDEDLRELLCEVLLSSIASSCVMAASLAELRDKTAEALSCSLAILDVNLGHGQPSGVDACKWLREQAFSGTILFLTGHARSHPLVAQAAKLAKARILSKPIDAVHLVQLVQESIG